MSNKSDNKSENNENNKLINRKTQCRRYAEMIKKKMEQMGNDWSIQALVEIYLDYGDEELAMSHAQSSYSEETLKNIYI